MQTNQPTPREVAEAKVQGDHFRGLPGVFVLAYGLPPMVWSLNPHTGEWSAKSHVPFPDTQSACDHLAAAQERAGVYARPEKAACECVDLLLSDDVRKSQVVAGRPDKGIWHPVNYDEWDRRYVWAFWERCRLCSRGVPLKPNEAEVSLRNLPKMEPSGFGIPAHFCPHCGAGSDDPMPTDTVVVPAAPGGEFPAPLLAMLEETKKEIDNLPDWIKRNSVEFARRGKTPAPAAPGGEGKGCWKCPKCGEPMLLDVLGGRYQCMTLLCLNVVVNAVTIPAAELEKLRRDSRAMDVLSKGEHPSKLRLTINGWTADETTYHEHPADALLAAEGGKDAE